ncbi:hypothetical protein A6A25_40960 [Saccharothrix sp. CB00851]|nr:hypothetical protein A6A25_40960 [Saccharothrix sp. CB00851]
MTGNDDLIRIGTGAAVDELFGCPSHLGVKVRPRVVPRRRPWTPRPELEGFLLRPVTDALDRVEHDGIDEEEALAEVERSSPRLHPGLIEFTRRAVHGYLSAEVPDAGELVPVRDWWVISRPGERHWELFAWGRRYHSADGQHREIRLARSSNPADEVKIAIAAHVAAFGRPALWPRPWKEVFQTRTGPQVSYVRVVEVDLEGQRAEVRFQGTPTEAERYYAEHGRKRVAAIVAGGPEQPGPTCAQCKQLTSCGTLQRVPGVLGLTARPAPVRTVSVSDLRYYKTCPAQYHLRALKLPKSYEYSGEAELGQAVHAWLEEAHRGGRACDPAAMPTGKIPWTAGRWRVEGQLAKDGADMLRRHLEVCVFHQFEVPTEVRVEPRLAVHDTAAQAVVLAKPDMLYQEDGGWVWREVKTTTSRRSRWYHDDLLDEFPQLALAVLFLAHGVLGGEVNSARVELEVLRPRGAEIDVIDPTDPERVNKARHVVQRMAEPWRADEAFEARPGRDCRGCPVSKWCPSFPGVDVSNEEE